MRLRQLELIALERMNALTSFVRAAAHIYIVGVTNLDLFMYEISNANSILTDLRNNLLRSLTFKPPYT